jgi:transmembrane sensor
MTGTTRPTATEIAGEAAHWVAQMDRGGWTDADEDALELWMRSDPRREGALLQAQAAWISAETALAPAPAEAAPEPRWWSRRSLLAGGGAAIAASAAGLFVLLDGPTRYDTTVGEIRRLPLRDGSAVAINTASTLDVAITDTARRVTVERGEAWFQVAKDRARPFVVEAGNVRVQAVGTAFSVRRRAEGIDIIVTEGVVEAWVAGAEQARKRIAAGSGGFVRDGSPLVDVTGGSAIDRPLAWRNGKIDLVGTTLGDAVAEFNRYNTRRLTIADADLGKLQVDGMFRTDDPEGFAMAVHGLLDVAVDLSDPGEIRLGKTGVDKTAE